VNGNLNGNKKKRRKKIIIGSIIGVLVLAIAGGLIAATRGGTKIDPSKLAKVEKGDLAKSVVATGKITPITKVEIKSKASGIVKRLYVDAGDRVRDLVAQHEMYVAVSQALARVTRAQEEIAEVSAMVKHEMESAYQLSVPLVADTGAGPNWRDAK